MRQRTTGFNINLLILFAILTHLVIISILVELPPNSSIE